MPCAVCKIIEKGFFFFIQCTDNIAAMPSSTFDEQNHRIRIV